MTRSRCAPTLSLLAALAVAGTAGCAAMPAAQMQLPASLAGTPPIALQGLKAARRGEFTLAAGGQVHGGRFERQADRLSLFDAALEFDKVGLRYTLATPAAGASEVAEASCRGRRTGATVGIVSGAPRPLEVQCRIGGAFAGTLTLTEVPTAAGTRTERRGQLEAEGAVLEVASVHRVQGSALPLPQPIGYTFAAGGRTLGAIEVNGRTPRLWLDASLQAADATAQQATLRRALLHAALSVALLWDPAEVS